MDIDRLLPDGPLRPVTGSDGTLNVNTFRHDPELTDTVHLALRAARVQLWRDLWQKVETVDQQVADATAPLRLENRQLRRQIRYLKTGQ